MVLLIIPIIKIVSSQRLANDWHLPGPAGGWKRFKERRSGKFGPTKSSAQLRAIFMAYFCGRRVCAPCKSFNCHENLIGGHWH